MHTDIDRLRSGGVKAQFWSVYVPVSTSLGNQSLLTTLQQIELVHAMCERYPDVFEVALTAADVRRIVESGKIASLMGVEGGHSIENSLANLQRLYQRGARYMTLTHSKNTEWADSCTDEPNNNGLSDFGRQVVLEMNRLGMLVDISHVSPKTMHDVLDTTKAPVIFSHSSTRAICNHPRNVPDDVLARLPENGGVVMINFFSGFIVPTDQLKEEQSTRGTIHDVVDHIVHAIEVAGVEHVGIGSDFDGISRVPVGLEDVGTYPAITQLLLDRGFDRESIHKVLGGNVLRVMEQAEAVARQLQSSSPD
jgi:membrane dipeptidase